MKRLFIGLLVTFMVVGSVVAKPKAKESPASAPIEDKWPELNVQQLCELLKQEFLPFKEVKAERAIYKLDTTQRVIPNYCYFWFPGLDSDVAFNKSVWGTYEVAVSPYKNEVRGNASREDFLVKLRESRPFGYMESNDTQLPEYVIRAYGTYSFGAPNFSADEYMASFVFVWMFSDSYYVFMPRYQGGERYEASRGFAVRILPDVKNGKLSERFRYDGLFTPNYRYTRQPSEACSVEEYDFDKFAPILESRLKKDGTAEQLAQWNLIKQEMQSYFAE